MKSLIILAAFSISLFLSYASAFSECNKAIEIEKNKNAEIERYNLSIIAKEKEIKEIENRLNTEKTKLVEDLRSAGVTLNDIESKFNDAEDKFNRTNKNVDIVGESRAGEIKENYLRLKSLSDRTKNHNKDSKSAKKAIDELKTQNNDSYSNINRLEKGKPIKMTGKGECIWNGKKGLFPCKDEAEREAFTNASKNAGTVLTHYSKDEKLVAIEYSSVWFTIQNNLCPINETDKTGWYSPDGRGGWRYAGREDTSLSAGMKYVYEAEYVFDGETLLKFLDEKTKNFANGKPERAEEKPKELTFEEKAEKMLREKISYDRTSFYKDEKHLFILTFKDNKIDSEKKTFWYSTKIDSYEKEGWEYGHLAPLVKSIKFGGKISEDGTKIEEKYFYITTEPYPYSSEWVPKTFLTAIFTMGVPYVFTQGDVMSNWKKYDESTNPNDKETYKKKAQDAEELRNTVAIGGGVITAIVAIYFFTNDNKDWGRTEWKIPLKIDERDNSPISMNIIPQPDGGVVLFSYAF